MVFLVVAVALEPVAVEAVVVVVAEVVLELVVAVVPGLSIVVE